MGVVGVVVRVVGAVGVVGSAAKRPPLGEKRSPPGVPPHGVPPLGVPPPDPTAACLSKRSQVARSLSVAAASVSLDVSPSKISHAYARTGSTTAAARTL